MRTQNTQRLCFTWTALIIVALWSGSILIGCASAAPQSASVPAAALQRDTALVIAPTAPTEPPQPTSNASRPAVPTQDPLVATTQALLVTITPTDDDYLPAEKETLAALRKQLARADAPPETRRSTQAKINLLQQQAKARAYGKQHRAAKDLLPGLLPSAPQQPTPIGKTGIITDFSPPFPAAYFAPTTLWRGVVDDHMTLVYAGSKREDLLQGLVIVQTDDMEGDPEKNYSLMMPRKAGTVTITAANGSELTLTAKDGTIFVFDVATKTLR